MTTKRHAYCLVILLVATIPGICTAQSENNIKLTQNFQALLIGFSQFELQGVDNLPSVEKDLNTLSPILLKSKYDVTRYMPGKGLKTGDLNEEQIHEIKLDNAVHDPFSTKETDLFKTSIRAFLKSVPRATKTAVIYVSTHGVITNDGLFFVVTDSTVSEQRTQRGEVTVYQKVNGLSYNWLFNEVANCKFDVLLIFDVCHAGEGNVPDLSQYVKKEKTPSENRVIVMARCHREQSANANTNYSHWLSLGMQGFADMRPTDGYVDVNELHEFVLQRFRLVAKGEEPMKFVFGAAQNPVITSVIPLSQDELILALAREIDFELEQAKDNILDVKDSRDKRICVFVPEFLPTTIAQRQNNNYETTRKLLAIKLTEHLKRFSEKTDHYRVISFDTIRDITRMKDNGDRSVLKTFSHLDDSPFIWIDGTIEPFDKNTYETPRSSKGVEIEFVKYVNLFEESMLHISCNIHGENRTIPLSQWSGLMNYVVQNPEDFIESYPVSIAPRIVPGQDPGDPPEIAAILPSIPKPTTTPPSPPLLVNNVLEPIIMVKNGDAPPMKSNPTNAEMGNYFSQYYKKRELRVTENNELRIDLKTGEEFIILLNVHPCPAGNDNLKPNPQDKKPYLFARVLIDGRNTLAQAIPKNEAMTLADDYQTVFRSAEHISLRNAEPWYIASDNDCVGILGFTSVDDRIPRAFKMTDQIVRDQKGNTISDYTGLIQIIVYLPEKRGIHRGTVMPGDPIPYELQLIKTLYTPGDMIGSWIIQYGN